MKMNRTLLTWAVGLMATVSAMADKPLNDYSFIRGACHDGGQGDELTIRRELGYAQKQQLNSTRIWLNHNAV